MATKRVIITAEIHLNCERLDPSAGRRAANATARPSCSTTGGAAASATARSSCPGADRGAAGETQTRTRADAPAARRTSAHASPVPQTSDKKPCANCGGRPCDGVEFERFASSGKRHKTCTTCKADRALRKAASQLRVLANPN